MRRIRTRGAHRWHPARARPRNTEPRVGVVRRRAAARRAPAALPRQCPHTLAASARIGCPRGALWALATRSPPRPAPRASARTSRSPAQRRRAAGTRGAARAAVYLPVPCAPRHAAMPRGRASLGKALHARQRRLLSTGTLEVGRSWMFTTTAGTVLHARPGPHMTRSEALSPRLAACIRVLLSLGCAPGARACCPFVLFRSGSVRGAVRAWVCRRPPRAARRSGSGP